MWLEVQAIHGGIFSTTMVSASLYGTERPSAHKPVMLQHVCGWNGPLTTMHEETVFFGPCLWISFAPLHHCLTLHMLYFPRYGLCLILKEPQCKVQHSYSCQHLVA